MNIFHQKAIVLKYHGNSYKEISKAIGGKLSEGVLRRYFSYDGMLHIPYLEFEAKQNQWSEEDARQEIKRMATYAAKIMKILLRKSLETHNWRLAFDILKDILDRAGITAIRTTVARRQEESDNVETYEDYLAECAKMGIDPKTGHRIDRALPEKMI